MADERAHFGGRAVTYVQADQSDPAGAASAIAEGVERLEWDDIDVVFLNAAMGWAGDPADEPADRLAAQIAVNLVAPIAIAHRFSNHLFRSGGRLVLIGSTAQRGAAQFATYAATKSALDAFARSLHEEWKGRAKVQIIHPGPIRTAMHARAGLRLGRVRHLFMPVTQASQAVQRAVRRGDRRRVLTRSFAWTAMLGSKQESGL